MSLTNVIRFLDMVTAGSFDIENLSGHRMIASRIVVLSALNGNIHIKKSEAGMTRLRTELYAASKIDVHYPNACNAELKTRFIDFCKCYMLFTPYTQCFSRYTQK